MQKSDYVYALCMIPSLTSPTVSRIILRVAPVNPSSVNRSRIVVLFGLTVLSG